MNSLRLEFSVIYIGCTASTAYRCNFRKWQLERSCSTSSWRGCQRVACCQQSVLLYLWDSIVDYYCFYILLIILLIIFFFVLRVFFWSAVDFFNQVNLLYGTLTEFCTPDNCPTMTAGPKYASLLSFAWLCIFICYVHLCTSLFWGNAFIMQKLNVQNTHVSVSFLC